MCNIATQIMFAKESIILIDDFVDDETIEVIERAKQDDVLVKIFSRILI